MKNIKSNKKKIISVDNNNFKNNSINSNINHKFKMPNIIKIIKNNNYSNNSNIVNKK